MTDLPIDQSSPCDLYGHAYYVTDPAADGQVRVRCVHCPGVWVVPPQVPPVQVSAVPRPRVVLAKDLPAPEGVPAVLRDYAAERGWSAKAAADSRWEVPQLQDTESALQAVEVLWRHVGESLADRGRRAYARAERDGEAAPEAPTRCDACGGRLQWRTASPPPHAGPTPGYSVSGVAAHQPVSVGNEPGRWCPRCDQAKRIGMPVMSLPILRRLLEVRVNTEVGMQQLEASVVKELNWVNGTAQGKGFRPPHGAATVDQRCRRLLKLLPALTRCTPAFRLKVETEALLIARGLRHAAGEIPERVNLSTRCPYCERRSLVVLIAREVIFCETEEHPDSAAGQRLEWVGQEQWRLLVGMTGGAVAKELVAW